MRIRAAIFLSLSLTATAPALAQEDPLDSLFGDSTDSGPELPEDPDELVKELIRRGRYSQALTIAQELHSKAPKDVEKLCWKLSILLELGRHDEAGQALKDGLKQEALNVNLNLLAGRLAEETGQLTKAISHYSAALKQNADSEAGLEASVRIGWLYLDRNMRKEAAKGWSRLLDFYDKKPTLSAGELYLLGLACRGLDLCPSVKKKFSRPMFKYAQLMFDQALGQDKRHVPTWIAYGESYSEKHNFADARKILKLALKINRSSPDLRIALATALLSSYELGFRRFELARFHLNECLSVHPNHPKALAALAILDVSDGLYDKAWQRTIPGLKRNPYDIDVRAVRGAIAVFRGDMKALEEEWSALKKERPSCARFFASVADIVGGRFRYAEARDLAARALKIDESYHPALSTYGLNLTRTGDSVKGVEILRRSQEADPFNVYVWNTLKVFAKINDPKKFKTYKTAHFEVKIPIEEAPSAPFILELLEEAHTSLGNKYKTRPKKVYVEFFSKIEDFSARSIGLPFIGALGVCFGNTMTVLSAKEKRLGNHSWGRTLWHEYGHVVTLTRTRNRVPRWLTEGLSVYEESRGRPTWVREYDRSLMTARRGGLILPLADFDSGFSKPKFNGQVMMSYYQGGMICEFIDQSWGFAKILKLLDAFGAGKSQRQAVESTFEMKQEEFDRRFLLFMDKKYAGYPQSILAPNPFSQMMQGVVLGRERRQLFDKLAVQPWDLKTRARLARVYRSLDKGADATTLADDVQKRVKTLTLGLLKNAQSKLSSGFGGSAGALVSDALILRQAYGDAEAVYGFTALKQRKLERAIGHLKEALRYGASDAPFIHQTLAGLAIEEDDYERAVAHLEIVARLIPPEAAIHHRLRSCYLKLGQKDKALGELIKVCLRDSGDLKSRIKVGEALYEKKRWRDLVLVLGDVALINPFVPESNFYLAEALRHTRKHSRALRAYETAIKTNYLGRESCHLGKALCYEALGKKNEAIAAAQEALKDDDSLTEATDLLKRLGAGD
jgi:tetratricopeptide (TPR) repeat protein